MVLLLLLLRLHLGKEEGNYGEQEDDDHHPRDEEEGGFVVLKLNAREQNRGMVIDAVDVKRQRDKPADENAIRSEFLKLEEPAKPRQNEAHQEQDESAPTNNGLVIVGTIVAIDHGIDDGDDERDDARDEGKIKTHAFVAEEIFESFHIRKPFYKPFESEAYRGKKGPKLSNECSGARF